MIEITIERGRSFVDMRNAYARYASVSSIMMGSLSSSLYAGTMSETRNVAEVTAAEVGWPSESRCSSDGKGVDAPDTGSTNEGRVSKCRVSRGEPLSR